MGDLKSCLFCGKNVDEAFDYCPHCGCEFGQGEDRSTSGGDRSASPADSRGIGGDKSSSGSDKSAFGSDKSTFGGELPGLLEETTGECLPAGDEDYLHRLRTLQEVLTDMERELDLIIAMDGEVGRGQGWPKGRR